jgi:hypothetical protein
MRIDLMQDHTNRLGLLATQQPFNCIQIVIKTEVATVPETKEILPWITRDVWQISGAGLLDSDSPWLCTRTKNEPKVTN